MTQINAFSRMFSRFHVLAIGLCIWGLGVNPTAAQEFQIQQLQNFELPGEKREEILDGQQLPLPLMTEDEADQDRLDDDAAAAEAEEFAKFLPASFERPMTTLTSGAKTINTRQPRMDAITLDLGTSTPAVVGDSIFEVTVFGDFGGKDEFTTVTINGDASFSTSSGGNVVQGGTNNKDCVETTQQFVISESKLKSLASKSRGALTVQFVNTGVDTECKDPRTKQNVNSYVNVALVYPQTTGEVPIGSDRLRFVETKSQSLNALLSPNGLMTTRFNVPGAITGRGKLTLEIKGNYTANKDNVVEVFINNPPSVIASGNSTLPTVIKGNAFRTLGGGNSASQFYIPSCQGVFTRFEFDIDPALFNSKDFTISLLNGKGVNACASEARVTLSFPYTKESTLVSCGGVVDGVQNKNEFVEFRDIAVNRNVAYVVARVSPPIPCAGTSPDLWYTEVFMDDPASFVGLLPIGFVDAVTRQPQVQAKIDVRIAAGLKLASTVASAIPGNDVVQAILSLPDIALATRDFVKSFNQRDNGLSTGPIKVYRSFGDASSFSNRGVAPTSVDVLIKIAAPSGIDLRGYEIKSRAGITYRDAKQPLYMNARNVTKLQ